MLLTQKTQYALRALLELAWRDGEGPIKIAEIADAQYIPRRFLEVILNQLKHTGLVESKRGYHGGYCLARSPAEITVGDVFRFMQKRTVTPDQCMGCESKDPCPLKGECVFLPLWTKVQNSIFTIYDQTTLKDLLEVRQVQAEA